MGGKPCVVRHEGRHIVVVHGVFGDTVNLGARLEGQAPPAGVVIGSETLAGLASGADVTALPEMHVQGKAQPVQAYVLNGLGPF